MGKLLDRNQLILRRLADLRPIEPRLRQIFVEGKRFHLLRGTDAAGRPFQAVKPETAKRRGGTGPPLAPRGASSRIVADYRVDFERVGNGLRVVAGWPMGWVQHHKTGGRRLPRRDPGGFRQIDMREAMRVLRRWVMHGDH